MVSPDLGLLGILREVQKVRMSDDVSPRMISQVNLDP